MISLFQAEREVAQVMKIHRAMIKVTKVSGDFKYLYLIILKSKIIYNENNKLYGFLNFQNY